MELEQQPAIYNGNPQVEDGHTKIANELLDQIINIDFTKRQYKILLFIIRKTYGWNKTSDDISRSQIVEATGLSNPHVTTTIQELLNMNVLIIGTGTHAKNYKINKHYDTWRITETVTIPKTVTVTETVTITETVTENYQNGNNSLPKQYPQKTITKDNTKDNNNKPKKIKTNFTPPIEKKLLDAWLVVRKARRAGDVTEIAWEGLEREAGKAGISPSDAVRICCERGWAGFRADWNWHSGLSKTSQSEEIPEWRRGML